MASCNGASTLTSCCRYLLHSVFPLCEPKSTGLLHTVADLRLQARSMAHVFEFSPISLSLAKLYQCPQCICILQSARRMFIILYYVTAFSETNLFQVSWGTKGSDKADVLPSVSSSKSQNAEAVVADTTQVQADVDAAFKETVTRAITKVETKDVPEKPTMDDENKTFRTRLVAMWILSNATLAITIENINGLPTTSDQQRSSEKQEIYFGFILCSTVALVVIRFLGVCG